MKGSQMLTGAAIGVAGFILGMVVFWSTNGSGLRPTHKIPILGFVRPMVMFSDSGINFASGPTNFAKFDKTALGALGSYLPDKLVGSAVSFAPITLKDDAGITFMFPKGIAFKSHVQDVDVYIADPNLDTSQNLPDLCASPKGSYSQALVAYDAGWLVSEAAIKSMASAGTYPTPLLVAHLRLAMTTGARIDGYGLVSNAGTEVYNVALFLSAMADNGTANYSSIALVPNLGDYCPGPAR